jgi:hypothetical protein
MGTNGDDRIQILRHGNKGGVKVIINGVQFGVFNPTSRILVFGQDGRDKILVSRSIDLPVFVQDEKDRRDHNGRCDGDAERFDDDFCERQDDDHGGIDNRKDSDKR